MLTILATLALSGTAAASLTLPSLEVPVKAHDVATLRQKAFGTDPKKPDAKKEEVIPKKQDPPKFKLPEDETPKQPAKVEPPATPQIPPAPKIDMKPVPKEFPKQKEMPQKDFGDEIKSRLPTEADAVLMALQDLPGNGAFANPYVRYIWIEDGDPETAQVVSLILNYISRASVIKRPAIIGKEKLMLVRVDLSDYSGKNDLAELIDVWEEFRFDPRFNLLITKDTLKFATGIDIPKSKRVVQKLDAGGKVVDEQEKVVALGAGDVVRVPAPHIGDPLLLLSEVLGTEAPIITSGYFLTRATTTVQGEGVFKTIYGGLYYQLSGIKRNSKKGTDEDNLLEALGVGNVDKGITAEKIFDDLRSDQRVAMFRSNVTGHPRRIDLLRSLASRDGQGLVWVTHDLKKSSIDIGQHPVLNLLDFKDDAREFIAEKRNGLHLFALFNGAGKLQDEVPPDIAADTTIPIPHGTVLEPARSCLVCHGKQGGLHVASNDVRKLRAGRINAFGDQKSKNGQLDDLDRLLGLYDGDLEFKLNPRARDDLANATLQATGVWKGSKDQTDVVPLAAGKIADVFKKYNYDLVDATQLLRDLGLEVADAKEAPAILRKILPLPPVVGDEILQEDARIGALLVGLSLGRTDYDLAYAFAALRIYGGR